MSELLTTEEKPFLSKWREKIISRKLLLWLTTTVFFCLAMVTEDTWVLISMIWLGMQGSLDFLKMWRESRPDKAVKDETQLLLENKDQ